MNRSVTQVTLVLPAFDHGQFQAYRKIFKVRSKELNNQQAPSPAHTVTGPGEF